MQCALLFSLALAAVADVASVTPVQKVITLLGGMLEKGKKERHEEQVQYATAAQFCTDTSSKKANDIKEASQSIDMLSADISKYTADVSKLGKEVSGLDNDVGVWQGDVKAASAVRKIEATDYQTTHKEYSESIDAMQRAIAVIKKQVHDRSQAESFAQVPRKAITDLLDMSLIPTNSKQKITSFLAAVDNDEVRDAPEANAYEFQSNGITDMLEKLQDKFLDERTVLEKEEANAKHAFSLLDQDLKAQITQSQADSTEKTQAKAKSLQGKASSKADLQDSSSSKLEDEKYLAGLTSECKMKASDFEARQEMRSQEIAAIQKAVEIISGGKVAGNAERRLPALLQTHKPTALTQLRANGQAPQQWKATFYLQQQAYHLNSRVLSSVAKRMQADPFAKVKKMLNDLVMRLMEEANEESQHKGWCDTELGTNEQTRKTKTQAVEMLRADIDETTSSIAQLGEDIAELSKSVAELDSSMAERTSMRQKEKKDNAAAIQDSQDAQTAVAQAIVVLKEFYSKAAESAALIQTGQPYQGMAAENGGVVGMLEVIESDFARLEAETSAGEATSQKGYDGFMTESKTVKASKATAQEHKASKRQNQQSSLNEKNIDLEGTQKILDTALTYFDKLKPSCVDSGTSFEDRVARRKQEIESLQEAMKILDGEDIA